MTSIIYEFCKNSTRIYGSTENIVSLKDLTIKLDLKKDEIWRSRNSKDLSKIFNFSLSLGYGNTLKEEIKFMRTIELFYPDTFSWRYNGHNIEAIAKIPVKEENLGIFGRFNGIDNFIKQLRKQLAAILKYREYPTPKFTKLVDDKIIATGSINTHTNLYVVDIYPNYKQTDILIAANERRIKTPKIKELNMKYWVREINPDFYKEVPIRKTKTYYPVSKETYNKYPECIKRLAAEKTKGNYGRFLLATFLLGVHNERDAKHQLNIMLSDEERAHITSGNCKDQWRAIVAKDYYPPSCKTMIENGYARNMQDCIGIGMIEDDSENI